MPLTSTDIKQLISDICQRLVPLEPYLSEIAYLSKLGYSTVEGLAHQRPRQMNPRYETLCAIAEAIEVIERRLSTTTVPPHLRE